MEKNWMSRHGDTLVVLAAVAGSLLWMNGQKNEYVKMVYENNEKHSQIYGEMNSRIGSIEKDVAIIKTVLIMKEVLPKEMAHKVEK